METARHDARDARRRCPLCHDGLPRDAVTRACPECDTAYHVACLTELGGCATAGCAGRPALATVEAAAVAAPGKDAPAPAATDLTPARLAATLAAGLGFAVALLAGGLVASLPLQAVIAWGEWVPGVLRVPLVVFGGLGGMATTLGLFELFTARPRRFGRWRGGGGGRSAD